MEIYDNVIECVRESMCADCGSRPSRLRIYEAAECERDCDDFKLECEKQQKEVEEEEREREYRDIIETERSLSRDMVTQWARRNGI